MFEMLVFLILNNEINVKNFTVDVCPLLSEVESLKVKYKVSGEVYVSCDHKYKISYSL